MAKRILEGHARDRYYRRDWRERGLALYLLLVAVLTPIPAHGQQKHPLTEERVISLLKSYVLPERVAELARHYGIDFEVNVATEREIRAAGGNQALIEALRGLAPHRETAPARERREATAPPVREAPASVAPVAPGTIRVNPKDGQKYVWIPPGTFQMGCSPGDSECFDNERPTHQVTISKGFWLGQTEVTVGAYKRFATETGRAMPLEPKFMNNALNPDWGNKQMPIVNLTWDDSQAYCRWAGGRLPSEAEWEYAARGGDSNARYGPLDGIAWYADNSGRERIDSTQILSQKSPPYFNQLAANGDTMHAAGLKRANNWGLHDTLGNVWEWVSDWYDDKYYQSSPAADPAGPSSGQLRVLRGGAWGTAPRVVRVSHRLGAPPTDRLNIFGVSCRCLQGVNIP